MMIQVFQGLAEVTQKRLQPVKYQSIVELFPKPGLPHRCAGVIMVTAREQDQNSPVQCYGIHLVWRPGALEKSS